mmetsp:Transcript_8668/g.16666  ORF Transcript_8668/g.16666 Transcript_8668/m.16666 type:complete len:132 (+) Transcript_8668:144-539(+)|eukprot:scaffold12186_cov143-Amphora_coffeaeformis.AAC.4
MKETKETSAAPEMVSTVAPKNNDNNSNNNDSMMEQRLSNEEPMTSMQVRRLLRRMKRRLFLHAVSEEQIKAATLLSTPRISREEEKNDSEYSSRFQTAEEDAKYNKYASDASSPSVFDTVSESFSAQDQAE